MPREKDLLGTIEAQARNVLGMIEDEIAELEARLAALREQHARWSGVLGKAPAPAARRRGRPPRAASTEDVSTRRAPKALKPAGPAMDWNLVLKGLASRFSAADIAAATPELDSNPRSRIVAVARWTRAKQVKKVASGQYEKVAERSRKRAAEPSGESAPVATDLDEAPRGSGDDSEVENPAA